MLTLWVSALEVESPTASFLHASWHSWMISTAYFLDLASPEKAKTFCYISDLSTTTLLVPTYLGLSIGDFVDSEPLVGGSDQARQVPLDILNVVEPGGKGVVDVNNQDLPVGLALVEQGHDTEDLDLLDLTGVADSLSDLADVEGVVVTVGAGLGVLDARVLPGLGESTVVPDVT
jgi:hypothetical protein